MDFKLLETLCQIQATSGDECSMKEFIIDIVKKEAHNWVSMPEIIEGDAFQDNLILVFGKPEIALYAHMDSVGFTSRYHNQLITIGSPEAVNGDNIVGQDRLGPIECSIHIDKNNNSYHNFKRAIEPGTTLVYEPNFKKHETTVSSSYLDNRLGVFMLLQLAKNIKNGVLVFSTYEEHGGGSAGYLAKYLYKKHHISQSLIVDVTWATEGIQLGHGPVLSLRDAYIPRKKFIDKIIDCLHKSSIQYQKEVEASGGSDGSEIQRSSLPIDWCFLGVAINDPHTSKEEANILDIAGLISLLETLSNKL